MLKKLLLVLVLCSALFATVSSETVREFKTCNGSTTEFSSNIPSNAASEISVYKVLLSTGEPTELEQDVDYTITYNGDSYLEGCTITITPAVAATYKIAIERNIEKTQETVSAAINQISTEAALDKLTRITQDLQDRQDRSIRLKAGDTDADLEIPADRANKIPIFDVNGNLSVATAAEIGTVVDGNITVENGTVNITGGATTITGGTITQDVNYLSMSGGNAFVSGICTVIDGNITVENGTVNITGGTTTITGGTITQDVNFLTITGGYAFLSGGTTTITGGTTTIMDANYFVSVKDIGATGDGITDDSSAIQIAVNMGGTVYFPKGTYYLGTTGITVPANTMLISDANSSITADTSTTTSLPAALFTITGSNVTIDGLYANLGTPSYVYTDSKGRFVTIGASGLSNIVIRNCKTLGVWNAVYSQITTGANLTNLTIANNNFSSYHNQIHLEGKSLKTAKITNNYIHDCNVYSGVWVSPSLNLSSLTPVTEENYTTDYGDDIQVIGNTIKNTDYRPLRITNCNNVILANNTLTFPKGDRAGANIPDDVITMELSRNFAIVNNVIEGGGENGIDILSSQDGVVSGNMVKQVDTYGISLDISDYYKNSETSPQLETITDREKLLVRNININGNYVEAFLGIHIAMAQNLEISGNTLKYNPVSTNRAGATRWWPINLDATERIADFFTESLNYTNRNIKMHDNKNWVGAAKECTFDNSTDIVTTNTPHNYVSGVQIQFYPAGTSNTVDFPSGVDYWETYFVYVLDANTFQLSDGTYAQAIAGANTVDITSNGLTVSNSKIVCSEPEVLQCRTQMGVTYNLMHETEYDKNIPYYVTVDDFSSMSDITVTGQMTTKHCIFEHIHDPGVAYLAITNRCFEQYMEIPDRIIPAVYPDQNTYGVERTYNAYGVNKFTKGTKMSREMDSYTLPSTKKIRIRLY